jgi:hypothetical protein
MLCLHYNCCTVYSVQCTVYSVQCTVYCTVYSVQCTHYTKLAWGTCFLVVCWLISCGAALGLLELVGG